MNNINDKIFLQSEMDINRRNLDHKQHHLITRLLFSSKQNAEDQGHHIPDTVHNSAFLIVSSLSEGKVHIFRLDTMSNSLTIENRLEIKLKESLNITAYF
ncbi:hypothetical protein BLNAU_7730 [Blattamonas nauphoetae]|uniref:Uncharacterized protein n=1 Tax=Blattamonas nauphoetae TaxID=2049346 RepID=A0ABQ9Y0U1_9EUKA|nr:hypothetical protein BLNAU_12855 [Blattamonas nauphoetae]KAK2957352.1 hypothetical protein BLNAU_7730 [Blattamonas nauphoetae]